MKRRLRHSAASADLLSPRPLGGEQDRGGGSFDTVQPSDPVDQVVEFYGARGLQLRDEVMDAADGVQRSDFRNGLELPFRGARELARHFDQHVGTQLAAIDLAIEAHREAFDDASQLQLAQAGVSGGAGNTKEL